MENVLEVWNVHAIFTLQFNKLATQLAGAVEYANNISIEE